MHFVYIIKSKKTGGYYTGETHEAEQRLEYHNNAALNKGVTKSGIPWEYFLILECKDKQQALKIEKHIKKMKSRNYIENLSKYPEMRHKLINRFS